MSDGTKCYGEKWWADYFRPGGLGGRGGIWAGPSVKLGNWPRDWFKGIIQEEQKPWGVRVLGIIENREEPSVDSEQGKGN